jgi:hypothetical protein
MCVCVCARPLPCVAGWWCCADGCGSVSHARCSGSSSPPWILKDYRLLLLQGPNARSPAPARHLTQAACPPALAVSASTGSVLSSALHARPPRRLHGRMDEDASAAACCSSAAAALLAVAASAYLRGMKRDDLVEPMPERPCLTGL